MTQLGDCWRLGDHLLLCGDAADPAAYEKLLGSEQAQCAVTSPPADPKEYAKDGLEPWLNRMAEVIRLLTHHVGIICWQTADLMKTGSPFIEPLFFHSNRLFADENFRPLWIRVWKMTGSVPATALQTTSNKPAPEFDYVTAYASDAPEAYNDQEYAWVSAYAAHAFQFVKRLTREERRKWGYAGVWEIAAMRSDKSAEPQIPVELPWRCIKLHSDLHGLILDPFAGLGTTLIACEQSGRRCRAMESEPLHCDLIVRRWEQFTGEKAEKIET